MSAKPHAATGCSCELGKDLRQVQPQTVASTERPPHQATVVQPRAVLEGENRRLPPHAAVAQPRRAFGASAERPPHPATVVQPRVALAGENRRLLPHAAVAQPQRGFGASAERPPHPATVRNQRNLQMPLINIPQAVQQQASSAEAPSAHEPNNAGLALPRISRSAIQLARELPIPNGFRPLATFHGEHSIYQLAPCTVQCSRKSKKEEDKDRRKKAEALKMQQEKKSFAKKEATAAPKREKAAKEAEQKALRDKERATQKEAEIKHIVAELKGKIDAAVQQVRTRRQQQGFENADAGDSDGEHAIPGGTRNAIAAPLSDYKLLGLGDMVTIASRLNAVASLSSQWDYKTDDVPKIHIHIEAEAKKP